VLDPGIIPIFLPELGILQENMDELVGVMRLVLPLEIVEGAVAEAFHLGPVDIGGLLGLEDRLKR